MVAVHEREPRVPNLLIFVKKSIKNLSFYVKSLGF